VKLWPFTYFWLLILQAETIEFLKFENFANISIPFWQQSKMLCQWKSTFFCIFNGYRGHHRKGIAIYNAANVNLKPKPCFH
jgi:hypothetical protein